MPINPSNRDAAQPAPLSSRARSVTIVPLDASMARAVQHMTFPAYRHLLSLDVNVRHPDDGDTRRIQPIGTVAMLADRPIGLALAESVLPIPPLPPSPKEGGLSSFVGPAAPRPQSDAGASGLSIPPAPSRKAEGPSSFAGPAAPRPQSDAGASGLSIPPAASPKEEGPSSFAGPTAPRPHGGAGDASSALGARGARDASGAGDAGEAVDALGDTAELLSLYVDSSMRGRGVGTALVAALETAMVGPRPVRLEAVYMTGKTSASAVERVFAKRGWEKPAMRTYTLRFTTDDAERMPWFGRVPLRERDFEMFAWSNLGQAERDELIASQQARPWIPEGLEFWRHDHAGFDPVSSLGLRYRGAVVGWTINHRLNADTTRISGAFVREDLSRRGRLMALWTESITRMKAGGVRWITSITPHQLAPMVAFLARRCAPWATFCGETRGTHIDLPARAGSEREAPAYARPGVASPEAKAAGRRS